MEVELILACSRCKLKWVPELDNRRCPRCQVHHRLPQGPVIVAGRAVHVKRIELFCGNEGLQDKLVRKGIDRVILGERCPHGLLSYRICSLCAANNN